MSTDVITVAVANLKPGTSKTTSAVFLCAAFHEMGLAPLLVDADKGRSAIRWADLIKGGGGFPWPIMGIPSRTIGHQLRSQIAHGTHGVLVVDLPQLEDHATIGKPALQVCRDWLVPCAPAGIELDRTTQVVDVLDDVDSLNETPARRWALLTRTNRRTRSKGESAPDARLARIMTRDGYTVFDDQVTHNDTLYRQAFGTVPDLTGTPFLSIAQTLVKGAAA